MTDQPIRAIYYDGDSPVARRVTALGHGDAITIVDQAGATIARWDLGRMVAIDPPTGALPGILARDADGAERLIPDDTAPWPSARGAWRPWRRLHRRAARVALLAVALTVALLAVTVFALPRLAGAIVALIPPESERVMTEAMVRNAVAELAGGRRPAECRGQPGRDALSRLTGQVMAGLDDPPHIRLIAVNSPQVNAFALPGGVIVVLRGQIEAATSPEELAGVLAHELGHVVARHAMVGAVSEYPVALTFSLLFGSVLGSSAHAAIAGELVIRRHTRADEYEADRLAYEIMREVRIDPRPLARSYARMARQFESPPAYLSTHPSDAERAALFSRLDWPIEPLLTDAQWRALRRICG